MTHVATSRPLVVSDDPHFVARAGTWCAALGTAPTVHSETLGLRKAWREAEFVVLDVAHISTILSERLPRREHVFLIGESNVRNLESAVALGASGLIEPEDGHVVAALAEVAQSGQEACVISVMGASGGVGASTLSAAIATTAAQLGRSAALVDADAAAGGIEFIIGAEREPGLRWTDLQAATGHIGLAELQSVLPRKHGVDVVSFGRDGNPVEQVTPVLNTLVRGYDTVVADVPRHLDDLGTQLVSRSVATVLVVPMRLGGVIAAEHLLPRIQELSDHVLVVAQPVKGGSDQRQLAEKLGVRVLAQWPKSQRTFIDVEHGLGPVKGMPRKVAHTVLETLGLV